MNEIQSKDQNKCVLLIPALNPEEKFISLLDEFLPYFQQIILVDDGSMGGGKKTFEKISQTFPSDIVHIVTHEKNKGKGVALKTGYAYYLENNMQNDFVGVITADSDGQHKLKDILMLCQTLMCDNDKVIHIGVRDLQSDSMPARSKFGNNSSAFLFKSLYGIKLSDTQSGLRAFSNDTLPWLIKVRGKRFEYEMNTLIRTKRELVRIVEHPIETFYEENHKSTFRTFRDSTLVILVLLGGIFQFITVGLISTAVDVLCFYFLLNLIFLPVSNTTVALLYATISARIISSVVNFILNRFFTFGKKKMNSTSIFRYYIVWLFQMGASYGLVLGFTTLLGGGETWIKIGCDFILMLISYQIQMRWVFKEKYKSTLVK